VVPWGERKPPVEKSDPKNRYGFDMKLPPNAQHLGELHNLSIRRGTLTDEDRFKINDHIVQTLIMLRSLPWPKHLERVPDIAATHHEKLDGKGYPRQLRGDQLSLPDRVMALADGSGRINLLNRLAGPGLGGSLWSPAEVTPAEWRPLDPGPLSGLVWDAEREIFLAASGRKILSFRKLDNRFIASAWPESPALVTSLVPVPAALSIGYQAAATLADGRILFLGEGDKTENPGTPPHMVSLGDVGGDFRLAFSRNGQESITWSRYGRVNLWIPPDFARAGTRRHQQQLQEIPLHEAETKKGGLVDPVDIAFGPAGDTLALFGRRDGFGLVFLYNLVRRRVEATLQVNDAIQIAVFGKDLWVLEKSGWLHFFENFEEQTRTM
jgi:hypothetical protein